VAMRSRLDRHRRPFHVTPRATAPGPGCSLAEAGARRHGAGIPRGQAPTGLAPPGTPLFARLAPWNGCAPRELPAQKESRAHRRPRGPPGCCRALNMPKENRTMTDLLKLAGAPVLAALLLAGCDDADQTAEAPTEAPA